MLINIRLAISTAVNVSIGPSAASGGKKITDRQMDVLYAVNDSGSITSAARMLKIDPSVAYRHIKEMERTVGEELLISTPRGSALTECGRMMVMRMRSAGERLSDERRFTVACSPVTEELLMSTISSAGADADLIISDDAVNMRMLRTGNADIVILDDPVHVFEDDSLHWREIAQMDMVHVRKGTSYIRYRYGAQRIAFRHLDAEGKKYSVDAETLSLNDLLNSGKSFFIDEVLLIKKGIRLRSSTDPAMLRHSILAVYREPSDAAEKLVNELLKRR